MPNFFLVLGLLIVFGITGLLAVKFSKNIFWGLLALIFFLPFERIPTLELNGFTLKINHLIGILLIVFFVLELAFKKRRVAPTGTGVLVGLLIFSFSLSFLESQLSLRSLIFFGLDLFVMLIFLITSQLIDSKEKLQKVQKVILITLGVSLLFAFFQFIGDMVGLPAVVTGLDPGYTKAVFGFPRMQGFSREPLYLGNLLLLGAGFCAASWLNKKEFRYFYVFGLALLAGILMTMSRGAILGLMFFGLMLFIVRWRSFITAKNITYFSLLALSGAIALGVGFSILGQDLWQKFSGHIAIADLTFGESTQGRLMAYSKALDAWRESPYVGIGLGNYGAFTADYNWDSPKVADIVNNEYLELLAESGIIGLAAFQVFLIYIFWRSWLAYRTARDAEIKNYLLALSLAMIAILFQYNFFSTFSILHIWVGLGILVAVQNMALQIKN